MSGENVSFQPELRKHSPIINFLVSRIEESRVN